MLPQPTTSQLLPHSGIGVAAHRAGEGVVAQHSPLLPHRSPAYLRGSKRPTPTGGRAAANEYNRDTRVRPTGGQDGKGKRAIQNKPREANRGRRRSCRRPALAVSQTAMTRHPLLPSSKPMKGSRHLQPCGAADNKSCQQPRRCAGVPMALWRTGERKKPREKNTTSAEAAERS